MKRHYFFLIVLLVALLPCLVAAEGTPPGMAPPAGRSPTGWYYQWVDTPKNFGALSPRSLAVDASGYAHVAYGSDRLYYAWQDGSGWHYEVADASPGVGGYACLALDKGGHAHIVFQDSVDNSVRYAYRVSSGVWFTKTLARPGSMDLALALDSWDEPHVLFLGTSAIRYVYSVGDGYWSDEEIVDSQNGGSLGDGLSLALDSANRPHASYGSSAVGLKYAYRDGSGWHAAPVPGGHTEYYTCIAVDALNQPHIAYYTSGMERRLGYAYKDAGGWHLEVADDTLRSGYHVSLRVDSFGAPRISYGVRDPDDYGCCGELRYAIKSGGVWERTTLETGTGTGLYTSIALGPGNVPHIIYYDNTHRTLKHVHWLSRTRAWSTEIVEYGAGIGATTSLALDSAGNPHISYQVVGGQQGSLLMYAYLPTNAQQWFTKVLAAGSVGSYHSLALDRDNLPQVAYYDEGAGDLRYVYEVGDGYWSDEETVDAAGDVGRYASLALDSAGRPRISYCMRQPNVYRCDDLRYAYRDGSGWHTETVAAEGQVGDDAALALDASGYPHIIYRDGSLMAIRHAYKTGRTIGWQFETIEANDILYGQPAIVCAGGKTHVFYSVGATTPDGYEMLKYGYKDTAGWHIENIGPSGDADLAGRRGLAIDRFGYPHVSYFSDMTPNGQNEGLWYARKTAKGWERMVVEAGSLGGPTALALDAAGRAHLSYSDRACFDLKYAVPLARAELPRIVKPGILHR